MTKTCLVCDRENKTQGRYCNTCVSKIRRHRAKQAAVAFLGGKCTKCGYNEDIVGLEFHHVGGETKEFALGKAFNRRWSTLLPELKKCVILCSICHRIAHASRYDPRFLAAVAAYRFYERDGQTSKNDNGKRADKPKKRRPSGWA